MSSLICNWDDFGVSHIISDQCRSWDCREKLDELHYINPDFKATLFTIPAEVTVELADWMYANQGWLEFALHGYKHTSNYECEKWTYEDMDNYMNKALTMAPGLFAKGFKAPGWQISDSCFKWLQDNGWWVSDQSYNDMRRPIGLPAYVNHNGQFSAKGEPVEAWHGHTWDCVGNGIYETFDQLSEVVKNADSFQFISEVLA